METHIVDVRHVVLAVPLDRPTALPVGNWTVRRNMIVVVETSDATYGSGEVWVNFPAWGCEDRIAVVTEVLKPLLVGELLDDPRRLFRLMTDHTRPLTRRWNAHGPVSHAIAGIDIALWDAHSRRLGLTLRDAIAGHTASNVVDVYASGVGPDLVGDAILSAIGAGHTRAKLRLVRGPEFDRGVLAEAREAAGELELMADPAEIYKPDSMQSLWPDIMRANLTWLEEPFPTDAPEMYDEFRSWIPRPKLALGESSYGMSGLSYLIDRFKPEVVQPDITKTGGITGGIEFGQLCAERGVEFAPHMLAGPIGFLATANLVAATKGIHLLEMDCAPVPSFEPMASGVPVVENGSIRLGDRPGHGAEVVEGELATWIECT